MVVCIQNYGFSGAATPNMQGSKGIRQRPINWCTSPMVIHKITPSVDCTISGWRNGERTNQSNYKSFPKVVKPTNKTVL